jgi:SAM-dependent methyltransferase
MRISEPVDGLLCDLAQIVAAKPTSLSEEFYRFFGYLKNREASTKYVAYMQDIFDLTPRGAKGARILDAGCGYGVTGLILAALGATWVKGLELMAHRVESFSEIKRRLNRDYPVDVQQCDIASAGIPLEDRSCDIVLANQSISHIRHGDFFFSEASRVLQLGGVLLIADENNGANPRIAKGREEFWEAIEKGPTGREIMGKTISTTVEQQRASIISSRFPSLALDEVKELAQRTSGLWGESLFAAVDSYINSGRLPNSIYCRGTCPVDPEGKNVELIFDPRQLAADLTRFGFRANSFAHFGGTRNRFVKSANSVLRSFSTVTLRYATAFRVVGQRVR